MNLKHATVECAEIPSARRNKVGWFENHQKHILLTRRMQPTTLLIGDSIVAGLTRYQNIWKKYFKFQKTVNCGTHGGSPQHVLWKAKNLFIPLSVRFIVIHCEANNLDYNDPIDIAKGILNIGKSLLEKAPKSNIILTGILPRDKYKSKKRNKLYEVNSYLNSFCKTGKNMLYMGQGSGWILNSHMLDKSLYYKDHLRLIEHGNAKFASKIANTIRNYNQLKLNFQLTLSCHLPSATPPRTISPSKPPPSASSLISPPSTSSPQPPPSISPPHPSSSASVSQPLPSVPPPHSLC